MIAAPVLLVEFELPGVPMSRANFHGHWSKLAKHDREWRDLTIKLGQIHRGRAQPAGPDTERRAVEIVMHRARLLDEDNLPTAPKPIIDALQLRIPRRLKRPNKDAAPLPAEVTDLWGAGLIYKDDPAHTTISVRQERATVARQRVVVRVLEAASAD